MPFSFFFPVPTPTSVAWILIFLISSAAFFSEAPPDELQNEESATQVNNAVNRYPQAAKRDKIAELFYNPGRYHVWAYHLNPGIDEFFKLIQISIVIFYCLLN